MSVKVENPVYFEQLEDVARFFIFGEVPYRDRVQQMVSARFPAKFYGFLVQNPCTDRHGDSAYSFRYLKDVIELLGPGDYVFLTQRHRSWEEALADRGVRMGMPFNLCTIYGTYETPTFLHFCRHHITRRGAAVDVGGNTGLTAAMLSAFSEEVHVLEANPEMEAVIRATNQGNETIHVVMKAVSRTEGHLAIYPVGPNNTSAVAHDKAVPMRVPCTTLDAYATETGIRPSVLKIDVEGVDGEVILGGASVIDRVRMPIFFEHPLANFGAYAIDEATAQEALTFLAQRYRLLAYPTMDQLYPAHALGMPLDAFRETYQVYPVNVAAVPL